MTGLAGLVRWQGDARDDTAMVQRMLQRIAGTNAVRGAVIERGAARLGSLGSQPEVSRDGRVQLVFDGRLDNRGAIASAIGATPHETDARLCCDTFAAQATVPAHLIGDFAAAAWWEADQRVVLMRDALGMRPLYYASTVDVCWWASTLTALLAPEWLPRTLHDGYFAEYLAWAPVSLTETPIRGAFRVPQAHALHVERTGVRAERYWHPAVTDERVIREGEAVEQFGVLLRDAIRARLPTAGGVSFQLSGGLDSSAVIALARTLGVDRPAAYSVVFPQVPAADESPYIDAMVAHTGCTSVRVAHVPQPPIGLEVFRPAIEAGDVPEIATGEYMQAAMLRRAATDGHTAMLTGFGGDDWLTGSPFQVTDLVRHGHLLDAWRFARAYSRIAWLNPGAWGWIRGSLAPLAPERLKRVLRRRTDVPAAPWLRHDFMVATQLRDRLRALPAAPAGSHVVRESLMRLVSGDAAHARDAQSRMARHSGLELRHPFLDRRLVEFLLSLPDALRFRHGQHRYVLRQVVGTAWPAVIARRLDKPSFDQVQLDGLRSADPDRILRERLQVVDRGWVDAAFLQTLWPRVQHLTMDVERVDTSLQFTLWQILGAEAAARALSSREF